MYVLIRMTWNVVGGGLCYVSCFCVIVVFIVVRSLNMTSTLLNL